MKTNAAHRVALHCTPLIQNLNGFHFRFDTPEYRLFLLSLAVGPPRLCEAQWGGVPAAPFLIHCPDFRIVSCRFTRVISTGAIHYVAYDELIAGISCCVGHLSLDPLHDTHRLRAIGKTKTPGPFSRLRVIPFLPM
jgi:hypothetical protein